MSTTCYYTNLLYTITLNISQTKHDAFYSYTSFWLGIGTPLWELDRRGCLAYECGECAIFNMFRIKAAPIAVAKLELLFYDTDPSAHEPNTFADICVTIPTSLSMVGRHDLPLRAVPAADAAAGGGPENAEGEEMRRLRDELLGAPGRRYHDEGGEITEEEYKDDEFAVEELGKSHVAKWMANQKKKKSVPSQR